MEVELRPNQAEQAAAADRAGMTVFRHMTSTRPARRLSFNVRPTKQRSWQRGTDGYLGT
jgi:hypothetical protein